MSKYEELLNELEGGGKKLPPVMKPAKVEKETSMEEFYRKQRNEQMIRLQTQQLKNEVLKEQLLSMEIEKIKAGGGTLSDLSHRVDGDVVRAEIRKEMQVEAEEKQRVFAEAYSQGFTEGQDEFEDESPEESKDKLGEYFQDLFMEKIKGGTQSVQTIRPDSRATATAPKPQQQSDRDVRLVKGDTPREPTAKVVVGSDIQRTEGNSKGVKGD